MSVTGQYCNCFAPPMKGEHTVVCSKCHMPFYGTPRSNEAEYLRVERDELRAEVERQCVLLAIDMRRVESLTAANARLQIENAKLRELLREIRPVVAARWGGPLLTRIEAALAGEVK